MRNVDGVEKSRRAWLLFALLLVSLIYQDYDHLKDYDYVYDGKITIKDVYNDFKDNDKMEPAEAQQRSALFQNQDLPEIIWYVVLTMISPIVAMVKW